MAKLGYDFAEVAEEDEVLFYLGLANVLAGQLSEALEALQFIEPDPQVEFFVDLILLKAQVLTETSAYQDAIDWLEGYTEALSDNQGATQVSFLLQGLSYRELGDISRARENLQRAVGLDSASDVASFAQELLTEL